MEITLYRNDFFSFSPAQDEDKEKLSKLKFGKAYKCKVTEQRNYEFLKKYFALINCTWEYLNEREQAAFKNIENFRKQIEICAGNSDTVYSLKLKHFIEVPKSIDFASMDEPTFSLLYDKVKDVIFGLVLKGKITEEEFLNNLINF